MNNSFGYFNELRRFNRQQNRRDMTMLKQVVIVVACLVAIVLIQMLGRP